MKVLLSLALALLPVLVGCGERRSAGTAREPGGRSLPRPTRGYILISIDTLRADHLGCYGYPRSTSPFLDSLARRSTLFEETYAQFPSTLVSHMSMFTGLHPREHGVFPPNSVLSPEVETLPEVFQRHGFRTAGFTEGGFMSGRFGFRRGFTQFLARDRNRDRQVEKTFLRGVRFLERLGPRDRFFLFLHTYAVHAPYDAPARYQQPFWSGEPPPGSIPPTTQALIRQNAMDERLPPLAIDWLLAQYDAGIRQTDEVLEGFFADLERLRLSDQVTVVVAADHGEEFQEHGRLNHEQIYREVLHVPLLIVHPDQRTAVRHGGVVQLVDIAPTLYDLARLEPGGKPTGSSLARLLGRPSPPRAGTAWADNNDGSRAVYRGDRRALESLLLFDPPADEWIPRRAVLDTSGGVAAFEARAYREPRRLSLLQEGKLLKEIELTSTWTPTGAFPTRAGRLLLESDGCTPDPTAGKRSFRCNGFQVRGLRLSRVELYDVSRDPKQSRDLSRARPRVARTLLRDLLAFTPQVVARATAPPLDPELEANLRALGYLR